MKLVSLTQPWAALVAEGFKRFETRSWHTTYRGPLAIHATRGQADPDMMDHLRRFYPEVLSRLETVGERGVILATCTLAACHRMLRRDLDVQVPGTLLTPETLPLPLAGLTQMEVDFGDWRVGRCALDLRDVRRVTPYPIPRGSQGRPIDLDPQVVSALSSVWPGRADSGS